MRSENWKRQFSFGLGMSVLLCLVSNYALAQQKVDSTKIKKTADSLKVINETRPTFRPTDRYGDPFSSTPSPSPFFLRNPKSVNLNLSIDTARNYSISEKIGNVNFRPNSSMSFDDFNQQQSRSLLKDYWKNKSHALDGESAVTSKSLIPKIYMSPVLDRIFGGSYVDLVPRGFVTLDFGANFQKIANPAIPIRQQRNGGFQFDQQINLSVVGKIGTKMKVTTNFDNNNSFDFQNNMKIEYTGNKEDILKKLEIGNVSLPLNNSLISGAQNLFGVKAQMQFGKLFVTALATTQRGKQSTVVVNGSNGGAAQGKPFQIIGSTYDENRHFFLSQFFRDHFETWLSTIPQISSGLNITRVEVYMLNRINDTQTQRNVIGFMDMAESNKIYRTNLIRATRPGSEPASNDANSLYKKLLSLPPLSNHDSSNMTSSLNALGFISGVDFETITSARKLNSTEYVWNPQLGYLTLQRKLANDEAIAVAYEYTYNGVAYKVGQLSEDYVSKPPDQAVYLKLLRPRSISIKDASGDIIPTWNLMLKNIYNLNVSALTKDGFTLKVIYRDDATGKDNPQLQDGTVSRQKQLIQVMGLDKLDPYNDPQPDGNFDYVEGVTVNSATGLIIFPLLEPFSEGLKKLFAQEKDPATRNFLTQKYVYDTLYHTTQAEAALSLDKNKFWITGTFKAGSGSDIIISGFNISPGSVKVYAGGTPLIEGQDYTVDYTFGKVSILNAGILASGKDITINYEQQDPFSFQTRSLLGTRFDYKLNDDVNLGGTFLYYNERPLISRNLIGTEPARNMMYGLDINVKKNSRLLTKLVDKLPFLETKAPSTVTFNAEFAQLLPGTSNLINGQGTSFIDDFENTVTPYSLLSPVGWKLASVPQNPVGGTIFDKTAGAINDVKAGYRRAKFSWYMIDNLFYTDGGQFKPANINTANHYVRPVGQQEIFPYRDAQVGNFYEPILNLAYFPGERGPYNYDPQFEATAKTQNWGGMTNAVRTEVDFDKANIEYIEFWMLDPFINQVSQAGNNVVYDGINNVPNNTGGQLVFNLGSISEDVLHDGLHAFENGLPTTGIPSDGSTPAGVFKNNWGYVTSQQFLNNAFDNDPNSRKNQDVGLDGASDAVEKTIFPATSGQADPSSDNFEYFLGDDLDARKAQITERYKNINGMENNSPVLTGTDAYAKSGSTVPDNEDINQDNTLSDLDQYYTYNINLKPGNLIVGNKFIVDKITPPTSATTSNDAVTWYLFRIPIRNFDGQFGNMTGFKSIRYIRAYLTGWSQPVVLRLANFRSVGNRWRAYAGTLLDPSFQSPVEPNLDNVTVSAVNVEENGQGDGLKPPYIEPLKRDRDNTSVVQRRLNEQSVQMCVDGLDDGDARAIYKSVSLDFFNYHHINMFMSVHTNEGGVALNDNDAYGFLRLGTDFDQNYYEIAIPLTVTNPNDQRFAGGNRDANAIDAVWPDANTIDLDLDELYALKLERDREGFPLGESYPLKGPKQVGKHLIRIFGRPDLSAVQLMMIGLRNPRGGTTARSLNLCLWADELRLTDFDRTKGWAVNSVVNAKLADLGAVTGSFKHSTLGFGGIQSKIAERQRSDNTTFDISGNINVDKLLPKSFGLKIPMFASYESFIINPGYDPANPDVRIGALLRSFASNEERSAYLHIIQDRSHKRSINFTNVRKVKLDPNAKLHPYDIENFTFNYAFSEATQTNFSMIENTRRNTKGSITYQYGSKFKGFEPFKKLGFLSSPFLQLVKDFNFNPFPTNISVRYELERSFNKTGYRNSNVATDSNTYNYLKYFVFNRYYTARWSLTKALTVDYNAKVNAIIDEPPGDIKNDSLKNILINNLKKGGRMKYFEQNITINYTVPFEKFPITNWLGTEYRHNIGYSWTAGPLDPPDSVKLQMGNIIHNSLDQGLTGRIDMVKLYNKIGWLKNVNTPKKKLTPAEQVKLNKEKPDTVKHPPELAALKAFARMIMSLRNITGTYMQSGTTTLPGFTPTPKMLGMDKGWVAPGWGFVLGSQDGDVRYKARDQGWMTMNPYLTNPFTQTQMKDLSLRAALEPSNDMKLQLDLKRTLTSSYQEIFRFSADSGKFVSLSPDKSGAYKISTITLKTAFKNNNDINSTVFNNFVQDIGIMQRRLNAKTTENYDLQSQDAMIPAFLAAYTGKNPKTNSLSPFPAIPLPGWRIDFNGLSKIPAFADLFQSITLNHAYSSSYSVMNFTNSLQYDANTINKSLSSYNNGTYAHIYDPDSHQLIPIYVISTVMISEQFAPLIGVSVRTKNKLNLSVQYKTSRNLSLTISNAQVTELNTKDFSMDVGFTKNNMKLPFKDQGRIITLKNDLTFKMTLAVTNTTTIQRSLTNVATITNGNINFQLRPNINYAVNKKLKIQFYVDRNVTDPLVTSAYRRATTQIGTKILFDLSQ